MKIKLLSVLAVSIFLGACSQITTLRTQEIRSVESNMQSRIDSLESKLDSMHQEQMSFQRRIKAELGSIVGAQENGINRMISMMEEMGYTVEKVAANTEKIKNKKIKVEHVIRSIDTSQAGMTISSIEDEEVDKLLKIAEEEFAKSNFKASYGYFKDAYKLKPTGLKAEYSLFQSGVSAYSAGQSKPANSAFDKVLELYPEGTMKCSTLFYKSLIAEKDQKFTERKSLLNQILTTESCKGKDAYFQAQQILNP